MTRIRKSTLKQYKERVAPVPLKEWLEKKYLNDKLSYRDMMNLLNTKNNRIIKKLLVYYNIPIRYGSEAVATQWIDNDIRKEQQSKDATSRFKGNTYRRLSREVLAKRYAKANFTLLERKIVDGYTVCLLECNECNNKIWRHQKNHNRGCSICMLGASKGEMAIQNYLEVSGIEYEGQATFDGCRNKLPLPFDFAILDRGVVVAMVEYQGEQHYGPVEFFGGIEQFNTQKKHDNIKRTYCKSHNIPLIEVPYTVDNIELYLSSELNNIKSEIQLSIL